MGGTAVRVEDVWKTYDGQKDVLRGINLTVSKGDMVLFWGRNGSGKTTLLNLIGCLDVPTRGKIYINGTDTGKLSERQLARTRLLNIGFVFQSHNLMEDLTVHENIALPLKIARDKGADEKVKRLMETFEIEHLAKKSPQHVSGGERQKVAIARALANNPSVLLADEPTASLDSESCTAVIGAFKKIREAFDATVIVASHDPLVYDHIEKKFFLFDGQLKKGSEVDAY